MVKLDSLVMYNLFIMLFSTILALSKGQCQNRTNSVNDANV